MGENINSDKYRYGDAHAEQLYREFVSRLKDEKLEDWLYGTSKKDDRPNDLGYWIGYKITEAYFNSQNDKHKAVNDILHMKDPLVFLRESGFLDSYIQDYTHSGSNAFDDFFKEYSDETYPVQITVKVPKPNDEVYIAGNQPELGSWNPSTVKMNRKNAYERTINIRVHLPAQFKFTGGSWSREAEVRGISTGQNIKVDSIRSKNLQYQVISWK